MANSYTLLANLRAGRCSNTAEVRLLRFWEARNINKGGELMSLEMLLINEVVLPMSLKAGGVGLNLTAASNANYQDSGNFRNNVEHFISAARQLDVHILALLMNDSYTFQLKLTDFNFTANHQTFTISRVFAAPEIAPIPNFAEAGEVPQLAVPQTVAPGSEAIGAMKSNVAGEASTSDGPLGGRETAEEEQVDLEESAPKKARVE
ncbi:hypothetical protein Bca4012_035587 [Brassica carinata]